MTQLAPRGLPGYNEQDDTYTIPRKFITKGIMNSIIEKQEEYCWNQLYSTKNSFPEYNATADDYCYETYGAQEYMLIKDTIIGN